jgi:hypothetical protein
MGRTDPDERERTNGRHPPQACVASGVLASISALVGSTDHWTPASPLPLPERAEWRDTSVAERTRERDPAPAKNRSRPQHPVIHHVEDGLSGYDPSTRFVYVPFGQPPSPSASRGPSPGSLELSPEA